MPIKQIVCKECLANIQLFFLSIKKNKPNNLIIDKITQFQPILFKQIKNSIQITIVIPPEITTFAGN